MSHVVPELHAKDRAALDRLVADLRALHGDSLHCVVLTGEAASGGYRPRTSPLTTIAVVDEVTPELLRRVRGRVRAWRRARIPIPLFMDPAYIETSLDVFPIEFLEIQVHHCLLYGDADPFEELTVDAAHLRLEVEEQLRGKMLHLWEAYLATAGSKRLLRRLLLETPPAFEAILRGVLLLGRDAGDTETADAEDTPDAFLSQVERKSGVLLPTFRRLETVRRGDAALASGDLERTFEDYLAEVRVLVRMSDTL